MTSIPDRFNFAKYIFEKKLGNKIAIVDDTNSISYQDLELRSKSFAKYLHDTGIMREDRMLILMPDSIESVVALLGCILSGVVPVLGNPWATDKTIGHYIEASAAKIILFESNRAGAKSITDHLAETEHQPKFILDKKQLNQTALLASNYEAVMTLRDAEAFWLFTSGSTGETKSVVHSHQSMIAVGAGWGAQAGYDAHDRVFATSKLFFSWGISSTLISPLTAGATTILHGKLHTPSTAEEIFKTYKPTLFASVPSFYVALINSQLPIDYTSLRLCVSAGEAITSTVQNNWQAAAGQPIIDGYGSTELLAPVIVTGKLVKGFEGQVKDADGNNIEDQVGELYIKGPSMALRYQNETEKSQTTFIGQWCKTGDKFIKTGDAYQFVGRSKDMLKVNANWVSPVEVENILMSHELVLEAGVSGIEDANGMTEIVAYVVLDTDKTIPDNIEHQLKSLVKNRLDYFKCPRFIRISSRLPKNTNGKIQRYLLNEQYNQQPD
jgi:benzoate-CoA ligase